MKAVGLITEDQSDVDVLHELAKKIATRRFRIKRFLGHGCGRIHAKSNAWAHQLGMQGCTLLIIACDLDGRNAVEYRNLLEQAVSPCPIRDYMIVIPIQEIEAWLLADNSAVTQALKLQRPMKAQANPETVSDPKRLLARIVRERSGDRITYLNTVHNRAIATHIQIPNLRRCVSFRQFEEFIRSHLT